MAEPNNPTFTTLVITGGSSGIGAAILQGFLKQYPEAHAINLSRTRPQLTDGAQRLHQITVDLSQREHILEAANAVVERLQADPRQGRVLLINNSGIGPYCRFQQAEPARQLETIDLNISATVDLTMQLLPHLLQVGGKIVTVTSTSAFQPTPRMATYGATKAFLLNWTLALGEDLRDSKVSTLAFCPGVTQTPFIAQAGFQKPVRSFWGVQKVQRVAAVLLAHLETNRKVVIPGRRNWLIAAISKTAPRPLSTRVAGWLMDWAKGDQTK